jgi:hypothetical protein
MTATGPWYEWAGVAAGDEGVGLLALWLTDDGVLGRSRQTWESGTGWGGLSKPDRHLKANLLLTTARMFTGLVDDLFSVIWPLFTQGISVDRAAWNRC